MRGIGFGLRTTRDSTVLDLGLATDLILASHNRDESFALPFLCFCFGSAELEVLQGLNSSEVSPSAGYRFWPPHRPRRSVVDLGLAIDLILASHNRDECFAVLFL